jgi:hypothetical protein
MFLFKYKIYGAYPCLSSLVNVILTDLLPSRGSQVSFSTTVGDDGVVLLKDKMTSRFTKKTVITMQQRNQ